MPCFAALDVSQETTAICVVDNDGTIIAETTIATFRCVSTFFLRDKAPNLSRVGLEAGPLAVWLWNALAARGLPVLCIDARRLVQSSADQEPRLRLSSVAAYGR